MIKILFIFNVYCLKTNYIEDKIAMHNKICAVYGLNGYATNDISKLQNFAKLVNDILNDSSEQENFTKLGEIAEANENKKVEPYNNEPKVLRIVEDKIRYQNLIKEFESLKFKTLSFIAMHKIKMIFASVISLVIFIAITILIYLFFPFKNEESERDCFYEILKYNASDCESGNAKCAREMLKGELSCFGVDDKNKEEMKKFCELNFNSFNGTYYNPELGVPKFCYFSRSNTASETVANSASILQTVSRKITISETDNSASISQTVSASIPQTVSKTLLETATSTVTLSESLYNVTSTISASESSTMPSVLNCIDNPCEFVDFFNFGDNKGIKCNNPAHKNFEKYCGSVCTNCTFAFFKKYGINDSTSAISFANQQDYYVTSNPTLGRVIARGSNSNGEEDLFNCPIFCFFQSIGDNQVEFKVNYAAIASYENVRHLTNNFVLLSNDTRTKAAMIYIGLNVYYLRFLNNTPSLYYYYNYNYIKTTTSGYDYIQTGSSHAGPATSLKPGYYDGSSGTFLI